MHLAGKIFAGLNVVLAILFLLLTAPVVKNRIEMQERIDREKAKVQPQKQAIVALDIERKKRIEDIIRQRNSVAFETVRGQNEVSRLQKELAILNDQVADYKQKVTAWNATVMAVSNEARERQAEIERLDLELADHQRQRQQRQDEVDDLSQRLSASLQAIDVATGRFQSELERLLKIEDQLLPPTSIRELARRFGNLPNSRTQE